MIFDRIISPLQELGCQLLNSSRSVRLMDLDQRSHRLGGSA